ncbi:MAG: hypothetical protein ACLQPH_01340 [Acidimicrobiales bacterium]
MELHLREKPAETGEEGAVWWLQGGALHLATEDRYLMAEHDDLDG